MKTRMKKLIGSAAVGMALLANTIPVWAGQQIPAEVTIRDDIASGGVLDARASSDGMQYIDCRVDVNYVEEAVRCSARDKNGVARTCISFDPNFVAVTRTMTDHSVIAFQWSAGSSTCSMINVNNYSAFLR